MTLTENRKVGGCDPTFILVHGTWADDSAWTKDSSQMRAELNASFFGNARFIRFRWSGRNSHRARLKAAAKLKRFVCRVTEDQNNPCYVIAHSHAGNVVAYALEDAVVEQRLSGAICLATPFITPHPREYLFGLKFITTIALLGTAIATAFSVIGLTIWMIEAFWPWSASLPLAEISVIAFFWKRIKNWSSAAIYKCVERRAEAYQKRLLSVLSLPKNVRLPVLSLQVSGDEARLGLSVATSATEIPFRIFRRLSKIFIPVSAILLLLFYLLFIGQIFAMKAGIEIKLFKWLFEDMGMFWITGPVAGLVILLALAQILMPLFSNFSRIGFGESSILAPLFVRLEVISLPEKWNSACQRSFQLTHKGREDGFLRHCKIYNDPTVLREMIQWLQEINRSIKKE